MASKSKQKTAGESSAAGKQAKTSPNDMERGTISKDDAVIEQLYASAYSGHWTKQADKFYLEIPETQRMNDDLRLNQLVALNLAAMVSNWNFIPRMLGRMSATERSAVLTHLRARDVRRVRREVNEYLKRKTDEDYSDRKICLDGSPESLLLAAATLGLFEVTRWLAGYIHIRNPARSGPLLYQIVDAGFYDVAYILCKRYPELSTAPLDILGGMKIEGQSDDSADEVSDESPNVAGSGSPLTILQLLAKYKSVAFRSCGHRGGGLTMSFLAWLFHLQRVVNEKLVLSESPKYGILKVMLRFLLPLRIVSEQIVPAFKNHREQEERYHYAEKLLEIIQDQILRAGKEKYREDLRYTIQIAALRGIFEIVKMCLDIFPSLIWDRDASRHILHDAIKFRHEKVFNLIRDRLLEDQLEVNTFWKHFQDIMILAACPPLPQTLEYIAGSALQMQKELHWFEEVGNVAYFINHGDAHESFNEARSSFVKNRETLVKEGEEWMKNTAVSCTVVAALVVTVVYQAAFQIPGGSDGETKGIANLLNQSNPDLLFTIFVVSDIMSLFFSATSLLLFLAVLTSRFSPNDFSFALPNRLILGLTALFIGLAAMMTSFTATVFIVLGPKLKWLVYLTLAGVSLPVSLFVWLQLPLFFAMVRSTYFGRPSKSKFKGLHV